MTHRSARAERHIEDIRDKGYTTTPADSSLRPSDITDLFTTFSELVDVIYSLPEPQCQHLSEAFTVQHPGRPLDSKGHLEHRVSGEASLHELGRGPGTDNKHQLQITPLSHARVEDYFGGRLRVPSLIRPLLEQCTEIHQAIRRSVVPVLDALDLSKFVLSPTNNPADNIHIMRILRYMPSEDPQEPIAELHFDRDIFTAAVTETAPGLVGAPSNTYIGDPNMTVEEFDSARIKALKTPIAHTVGRLCLFPGAKYNHLPLQAREESGNVPLLLHGVNNAMPGVARFALVYFMHQHFWLPNISTPAPSETRLKNIRDAIINKAA